VKGTAGKDAAKRAKETAGEERQAGDARWLNLHDQMAKLIDLLGYSGIVNTSRLFVKKMQASNNY